MVTPPRQVEALQVSTAATPLRKQTLVAADDHQAERIHPAEWQTCEQRRGARAGAYRQQRSNNLAATHSITVAAVRLGVPID